MRGISLLKIKKKPGDTKSMPANKNVMVSLSDIKKGVPFINLFPIMPEVLKAVTGDMKTRGFDMSQPVVIWKETNLLIDGHTRCKAAEKAGVTEVAAIYKSFPDVDSALRYAYGLQFKRRNLTDADRFHFSETYLNKVGLGVKKSGLKKVELAEILSVSTGTAQKYISVLSRGSAKDQEAVRSGYKTINKVYKSLLDREKQVCKDGTFQKKKASVKGGERTKISLTIDPSVIRQKLDQWADEMNEAEGPLNPAREMIHGVYEILPDNTEIKNYVRELLNNQDSKRSEI